MSSNQHAILSSSTSSHGSRYRGSFTSDSCISSASASVSRKCNDISIERDMTGKSMNADQLVKFSRQLGTSRPTNLVRDSVIRSHPSRGGSNGFPVTERQLLCNMWLLGLPVPRSRVRSIQRWLKNGVLPLRQTGNRGSSVIRGEHLFLLTVFKKIYPHASRSEGACFVASHSTDGRVLTDAEVTRAMRLLNMTRKKGSTRAYQAFTPKNMYCHFCFWNFKAPGGIYGVHSY